MSLFWPFWPPFGSTEIQRLEAGDHFLAEAGVQVLFHTSVIDVLAEGDQVRGVLAWTKQGRAEIRARLRSRLDG